MLQYLALFLLKSCSILQFSLLFTVKLTYLVLEDCTQFDFDELVFAVLIVFISIIFVNDR